MKDDENDNPPALENAADVLREYKDGLTNDLTELNRDIRKFGQKDLGRVSEMSVKIMARLGHHPYTEPARLEEVIELARKTITQQKPSERMVDGPIRDAIAKAVQFLKERYRDKGVLKVPVSDALTEIVQQKIKNKANWLFDKKDDGLRHDTVIADLEDFHLSLLIPEKCKAIDKLLEAFLPEVVGKLAVRIPDDEKLDKELIARFYIYYALFTEYFKSMKMLYQVLLKEYEELELLDDNTILEIRRTAIKDIALDLAEGKWKGPKGMINRAEFRLRTLCSIRSKIHEREDGDDAKPPIAALCLSGGGIRSATFSLGVIQALARHNMLDKFDYLSTVSGGGYIGGWLSAWINREKRSSTGVQKILATKETGVPEPAQVTHLRAYSNYMTPRLGIGSADTWTVIAVYLRNLLLNWTVVIPLAAALLLIPKILSEIVSHGAEWIGKEFSYTATALMVVSVLFAVVALFCATIFRPSLSKLAKKSAWLDQLYIRDDVGLLRSVEPKIVKLCVVPMLLFAVGVTVYWSWVVDGRELHTLLDTQRFIINENLAIPIGIGVSSLFMIALIFNLVYRRQERKEKMWEAWFASLLFLACVAVTILLSTWITSNLLLFGIVSFASVIFTAGFFPARVYALIVSKKHDRGRAIETVAHEFSIAFLAAACGGFLLFAGQIGVRKLFQILRFNDSAADIYTSFAVPVFLILFLLAGTIFIGIGSKLLEDEDREWLSRVGAWLLMLAVGWAVVFSLVLLAPPFVTYLTSSGILTKSLLGSLGGISGIITLLFGFFAKNAVEEKPSGQKKKSALAEMLPKIAAPIFAAFLIILLVMGTDLLIGAIGSKLVPVLTTYHEIFGVPVVSMIIAMIGFAAVGLFMGCWVNINKFSLHAMYRDRIIRAYLGASRGYDRLGSANSFTGLDNNDNLEMRALIGQRPFHVLNMTLNLANSANLRWQNRKSESFTATPYHCGSSNMGEGSGNYRSSKVYASDKHGVPITLGTAVAISGAAASPNMGYFTQSAPVSALMALFNVRLGWWLGNPGSRGKKTYMKNAPEFAAVPMANEARGNTGDTNPYVYLSDGGHFENLALYEMVLRRAKFIVVCDGTADPDYSYSDLALAIHKIRVDMGVTIEFEPEDTPKEGQYCAIARIKYSDVDGEHYDDGVLIYLKPTINGNEPIDIANYKKRSPNFPHESTGDQMYSETQFESYRLLGFHMMDTICGSGHSGPCTDCVGLTSLEDNADDYLDEMNGKTTERLRLTRKSRDN